MHLSLPVLRLLSVKGAGSAPIGCGSLFCFSVLCVLVLQSSWVGGDSVLLYFDCLSNIR